MNRLENAKRIGDILRFSLQSSGGNFIVYSLTPHIAWGGGLLVEGVFIGETYLGKPRENRRKLELG